MDVLSSLQYRVNELRGREEMLRSAVSKLQKQIEELAQETQNASNGRSGLSSALETLQTRTIAQRNALASRGSLAQILTSLTDSVGRETQAQISNASNAMETARRKEAELRSELECQQRQLDSVRSQIADVEYSISITEAEE